MADQPKAAISESEAARVLGVSAACMRRWRREKRGPRYFRAGRLVRYFHADIERWAAANSTDPAAEA